MRKTLLLLMALGASALTLWSQEPVNQSAEAAQLKSVQVDMPIFLRAPESVMIAGTECRLDKYVSPENKMEEYVYDGNSITCNRYEYDWSTNAWRDAARSTSEYNEDGRLISFESYYFNPNTNQWKGGKKVEYGYDPDGRTVLSAKYRWSESKNDWYCEQREESRFSETGQKIYNAKWLGNETDAALKGSVKTESVLDDNHKVKEKMTYLWNAETNDWALSYKEAFKYTTRGFTSENLRSDWNPATNEWEQAGGKQYQYSYGLHGKVLSVKENEWNNATSTWEPKFITSYGYDQNGCKIYRVKASALEEDPLNGFEKDAYEYNDLKEVTAHYVYVGNPETKEWRLTMKDEFTFDDNKNVSSSTRYKWLEGSNEFIGWQRWEREYKVDHMVALRTDYRWDSQTKNWVGKCLVQYPDDEMGLGLKPTENYKWTTEGWIQNSFQRVDIDPENLVATVSEYELNTDNVISQDFYYYRPIGTTGITDVFQKEPANILNIDGNCISASDDCQITIYSIDGKLVNSAMGKVSVPTSGFYIVKVGDQATKVYVK